MLERLRTERDELRVRAHLAKAEMKEEWEKLEDRWEDLEVRAKAVREEASDASKDVGSALEILGDELSQAYRRIRNRLQ
jgi:predicted  nucleic acid-binding Zn-ribbon protein